MKQTWKCESCNVPCTLVVQDDTRIRFEPPRLCPYFSEITSEWKEVRRGQIATKPRR